MNQKISRILPALAVVFLQAALLLSACSPRPTSAGSVQIGSADVGKTIHLQTGQRLVVALEGNPTTGYTWEAPGLDQSVLKPVGEPDFKADSSAAGSGGRMSLTYEAVNPGQVELALVYHRPWEQNVDPLQTFNVTVNVAR